MKRTTHLKKGKGMTRERDRDTENGNAHYHTTEVIETEADPF